MDATKSGSPSHRRTALASLTLTAIGVVYGDIGTSPLYAMRECFFGSHSVPPTHDNVLGVLSLIIYALLIVISIKYIAIVMRADNDGEGGILALMALVPPRSGSGSAVLRRSGRPVLIGLGIFGASLLYGDGMITPAITVLGAIEGVNVATPLFEPYVVPVAVAILVCVFSIQKYGTHSVGRLFGPVMVVWFVTIALLGIRSVVQYPAVLGAVAPQHAVRFFSEHGMHGFAVLGAVFLVVTGGEALYADMGHFGRRPIRIAWFSLVLPALLLNYFGQGALLLVNEKAAQQPFFLLAPGWALIPLVVLATLAAIIASQALISGAFSLTRQAIQLGYAPRLDIEHTSSREIGQVYVPQVNFGLMVSTILIVIGFKSSSALAAAYGIAVTMTMVITVVLLHVVATERWKWPLPAALLVSGVFLSIDLAFLGANLLKITHGGWLPLVIGTFIFTLMTTWKRGREILGQPRGAPPALTHNLRHNKVLHERVVILTVRTEPTPHVALERQVALNALGTGVFNVVVIYGFMQDPDVPDALRLARAAGLEIDDEDITYFLGRETIIVTTRPGMAVWREQLFVLMARNAVRATAFFRLPPERVVELGVQVEM